MQPGLHGACAGGLYAKAEGFVLFLFKFEGRCLNLRGSCGDLSTRVETTTSYGGGGQCGQGGPRPLEDQRRPRGARGKSRLPHSQKKVDENCIYKRKYARSRAVVPFGAGHKCDLVAALPLCSLPPARALHGPIHHSNCRYFHSILSLDCPICSACSKRPRSTFTENAPLHPRLEVSTLSFPSDTESWR